MNLEQSLNCLFDKGFIDADRRTQLMQTVFRLPQAQSPLLQLWFAGRSANPPVPLPEGFIFLKQPDNSLIKQPNGQLIYTPLP